LDERSARHKAATYTHNNTTIEKTHTHIQASSGIRTHDPSVKASEDSSCLRPRGHCDRSTSSLELVIVDSSALRGDGSIHCVFTAILTKVKRIYSLCMRRLQEAEQERDLLSKLQCRQTGELISFIQSLHSLCLVSMLPSKCHLKLASWGKNCSENKLD
jgi:hypothetical protein